MVFAYFAGDINMIDIRFNGELDYTINNIGFIKVLRNENFSFPYKNGKEQYTFIFIESGEMNYCFIDTQENVNLTKGNSLFIPKNTPYIATYTKDDTVAKILTFDINSDNLPSHLKTPLRYDKPVFSDIYGTISGRLVNNSIFLASKIYEILYIMGTESIVVPDKFKKILPAINEIEQFYYKNKKLSYYSDMCYMSEQNFRKLFKEYTGKSFIEYRNILRIYRAQKLINSGEYSINESARLVGFNNMSFFYETYKKYIKLSEN